jgi:hypothetical protein
MVAIFIAWTFLSFFIDLYIAIGMAICGITVFTT